MLERPEELLNTTKQTLLRQYADQVRLCQHLVLLNDQLPCVRPLEEFQWAPPDPQQLDGFLTHYSLQGLRQRVTRKGWLTPSHKQSSVSIQGSLQEAIDAGQVAIALDITTEGYLKGAGISYGVHKATYIDGQDLQKLLAQPSCLKIFHDAKAAWHQIDKAWYAAPHPIAKEQNSLLPMGSALDLPVILHRIYCPWRISCSCRT